MVETIDSTEVEYGTIRTLRVHLDDLDHMGVMHNSRHGLLVERALVEFWAEHGVALATGSPSRADQAVVVRQFAITYRKPVRRVGPIRVHLWVADMDEVTRTYGFRLLSEDHSRTYADGTLVTTSIDRQTGHPARMAPQGQQIANLLRPPPHNQDQPS